MKPQIFFTADTHFGHKNILKYATDRMTVGGFGVDDTEAHDKWLIDRWNSTIGKKDIVYIIGDFAFGNREEVIKLLSKLHGCKHLILGNHDASSEKLTNYFNEIKQLKSVKFKKGNFDFLEEDFNVYMGHCAMVVWPEKHYGTVHVCGHSHGKLDDYNDESTDLRVDVGLDGRLANLGFITLEQLYRHFKEKTKGMTLCEYARKMRDEKTMTV